MGLLGAKHAEPRFLWVVGASVVAGATFGTFLFIKTGSPLAQPTSDLVLAAALLARVGLCPGRPPGGADARGWRQANDTRTR